MDMINLLQSPPDSFRPYPFWFWNDRLSKEEITWQLEECRRKRIVTVLIHPRHGLVTPYLGEEFMAMVVHTVREARRLGMKVWLYDEYNWPSGTVAGRLLRDYPQYKMKFLHFDYSELNDEGVYRQPGQGTEDFLGIQGVNLDTGEIRKFRENERIPAGRWGIGAFHLAYPNIALDCVSGHSGTAPVKGYVDVLNPQAIRKFIEMTHEVYFAHLKDYFGSTVLGFFTDEPGMIYDFDYGYDFFTAMTTNLPWTPDLAEEFLQRKGYRLQDRLIHLAAEAKGAEKTRRDYWQVATSLYNRAYHEQLAQWCKDHGVAYTGHVVCEEMSLHYQGDLYTALKDFHIPGLDWTSRECELDTFVIPTAKIVSSIAHLHRREFAMCETFGATGWGLTLNDMKRVVDFLYLFGVTQMCLHGFFYSIKAGRMYECAPSEFFQTPWWKYMDRFSDYVARLGLLLSQGVHDCRIGLLVPTRIQWAANNRTMFEAENPKKKTSEWVHRIAKALMETGIDYEYIFDSALTEDRITREGIIWGEEKMDTLIIPPVEFLTADLWTKLKKFAREGGKIFVLGPIPRILDDNLETVICDSQTVEKAISQKIDCTMEDLKKVLPGCFGEHRVRVLEDGREEGEIAFLRRKISDDKTICFALNFSKKDRPSVNLVFPGNFQVKEINLERVAYEETAFEVREGKTFLQTSFFSHQSRVFWLEKKDQPQTVVQPRKINTRKTVTLGPDWEFGLERENVFKITELLNIPLPDKSGSEVFVDLHCDEKIGKASLVLEGNAYRKIRINRIDLTDRRRPYRFFDGDQFAIDIAGYLHQGHNRIALEYGPVFEDTSISGLMAIAGVHGIQPHLFLIGDFGVTSEGHLAAMPQTVKTGSWREQGFSFYAGTGIYRTTFTMEKADLDFPVNLVCDVAQGCLEVIVNGRPCGIRIWEPYTVEVTGALRAGENQLELKVTNTPQDLFRPLASEVNLNNRMAGLRGTFTNQPSGLQAARIVILEK